MGQSHLKAYYERRNNKQKIENAQVINFGYFFVFEKH